MPDLTKLQSHTGYNTFKNNSVYTGSATISGVSAAGINVKTFNVTLARIPDIMDVVFNGATDTVFATDPRPANGWFKRGAVWVRGDNGGAGYVNYPTPWELYTSLNGLTLTITAIYAQQFSPALTLTPEIFSYKIVDYSVF